MSLYIVVHRPFNDASPLNQLEIPGLEAEAVLAERLLEAQNSKEVIFFHGRGAVNEATPIFAKAKVKSIKEPSSPEGLWKIDFRQWESVGLLSPVKLPEDRNDCLFYTYSPDESVATATFADGSQKQQFDLAPSGQEPVAKSGDAKAEVRWEQVTIHLCNSTCRKVTEVKARVSRGETTLSIALTMKSSIYRILQLYNNCNWVGALNRKVQICDNHPFVA